MTEVSFWLLVCLVAYVYAGYPLCLAALVSLGGRRSVIKAPFAPPAVSLIITAYNEEGVIGEKLENSLELAYAGKLEIIVASDGSTDRTDQIIRAFSDRGVRLVRLDRNRGKSAAQSRAVREAQGEVLLLTDADVMLAPDVLERMIGRFADEKVGCVVGRICYVNGRETGVARGEGAYWRYECYLRGKESTFGNLAMASGFFAIRQRLFGGLDEDEGDDFVLPIRTAIAGYKVVFEEEARSETVLYQVRPRDMFRTRVRVITKDMRGLFSSRAILNPFLYPRYAWGLISHKLLRWLVPYMLLAVVMLNLALKGRSPYELLLVLQLVFYGLAATGLVLSGREKIPAFFSLPSSFLLVNLAALVGVARAVAGRRSGRWKPVRASGFRPGHTDEADSRLGWRKG